MRHHLHHMWDVLKVLWGDLLVRPIAIGGWVYIECTTPLTRSVPSNANPRAANIMNHLDSAACFHMATSVYTAMDSYCTVLFGFGYTACTVQLYRRYGFAMVRTIVTH